MARRGSFGRSGTTQNLTMLVYQIMKQQMTDELDSILTAYKTNMESGMYKDQFNGQNVDGEYVISYYEQMLGGFPPGTTEYETISSKLERFRSQYETDIENLAINSMNNGTKIDFGLLGSSFSNKGISEVTLTDVEAWANDRIAQLKADGNLTQADKLSGSVYVAKFNVENDGKVAAVDRDEMSWGGYAKWLKGQLADAKSAGLTEESQVYRDIVKAQASAMKQAKAEGEGNAREAFDKKLITDAAPVNNAAKALIEKYLDSENPISAQAIYDKLEATTNTISPYYDVLQSLAKDRQLGDQTFNAIMNASGIENAAELFSEAVTDYSDTITANMEDGLKGLSTLDAASRRTTLVGINAGNKVFVSNSGVAFFSGAGKTAVDSFIMSARESGASIGDLSQGTGAIAGGHPTAILDNFKALGEDLDSLGGGGAYPWLNSLAQGYISTSFDEDALRQFDTTPDGKVTIAELETAFRSGVLESGGLNKILEGIIASSGSLDMPTGRLNPEAVVKLWGDAVYDSYRVREKGSVVVADSAGFVSVTEENTASVPDGMAFSLGKYGLVYVKPVDIMQKSATGESGAVPMEKLGNMSSVKIYGYPGIGASTANIGTVDAMVVITGAMYNSEGNKQQTSIKIPFDLYRKVLAYSNIELEADSFENPRTDIVPAVNLSFEAGAMKPDFMANVFTNPDSEYYITKLVETDPRSPSFGKPIAPEAQGMNFTFNGYINPYQDENTQIESLFSTGRDNILRLANDRYARANPGVSLPLTRESLISTIASTIPGLGGGVQDTSITDLIVNSKVFQDKMTMMFPEFKPAAAPQAMPYLGSTGQTPTASTPYSTSVPGSSSYMQNQASFLEGAFRKATPLGMNPTVPKPQVPATATPKPYIPASSPTVSPIKPSLPKPYVAPTTGTATPKVTPAGTTGTTSPVNTGYTRGVS